MIPRSRSAICYLPSVLFLLLSAICHLPSPANAAPATLSISSPAPVPPAGVTVSTVSVDVGSSSVLGAADFTVTFDTQVARLDAVQALAAEFQNNFFFDPAQFASGRVRILALNASTATPSGTIPFAALSYTAVGVTGSSTTLQAANVVLADTQPVVYTPITVAPGSFSIVGDTVPPVSVLAGSPQEVLPTGAAAVSTRTALGIFATDPVINGFSSGVAASYVKIDTGPFTVFASSFTFPKASSHTVQWYSRDNAGNTELLHSATVYVDTLPPVTGIVYAPGAVSSSGILYITSQTVVGFSTYDPVYATVKGPVSLTDYRLDPSSPNAAFQTFASSFTLAEGTHTINARSRDFAGHLEAAKTFTVSVDGTPPVSVLTIGNPQRLQSDGSIVISSFTFLSVTSTDPVSGGVASGVKKAFYQIDTGDWKVANSSFTIKTYGSHLVGWYSLDKAGNVEASHRQTVQISSTAFSGGGGGNNGGIPSVLPQSAGPDPAFVLHEVFVFPNPARGGAKPAIHVEAGLADEVTIRIFDAAGRELQEVTLNQAPAAIDSGKGLQFAYEYTWDAHIPSGVYFYTVRAKKAGADDLMKKGKFAVVR